MKDNALKVLPILVGVALGFLLVSAPEWFRGLGPARFLVAATLVFIFLVSFVALTISANLPADIRLTPTPETDLGQLRPIVESYQALGFSPAGPALFAGVSPPALMVPLVHPSGKMYATVFRTGTVPAKTSFDVVSLLDGGRGGLTTSPTPAGATLPAASGNFRQVFNGVAPSALVEHHRAALAYLEGRGLPFKPVSAPSFTADFKAAVAAQRAYFLAHPIRCAVIAIWRSATKLTPHTGPIEKQPLAQRQIAALATGRRG
jgi:hypothetical protein